MRRPLLKFEQAHFSSLVQLRRIANQFVEDIKSVAVKFQPMDETMRKAMVRIAHGLAPNVAIVFLLSCRVRTPNT